MTREGWEHIVLEAVSRYEQGDSELLQLLSQLLEEQDLARQALRDKGYGWIGLPWDETVALVKDGRR